MHILALDTTSRAGSVAVLRDGNVLHQHAGSPEATHGERLPGDLARALDAAGIRVADLDLLAVAAGPGSFTGLRVGIAAVQGLAVARGLNVVPVSTLEALAESTPFSGAEAARFVAPWMDGQRGEVFASLYDAGGREIAPPTAAVPAGVLEAWRPTLDTASGCLFVGDGAVRYRTAIEQTLGSRAQIAAPPPLAPVIGRIAARHPGRAVSPHDIVPVYVRRPDAELARERQGSR